MKAVLLTGILILTQAISQAGDTAYQALRIIGKTNPDFLNHVIEAHGNDGQPQPVVWSVLIDDQTARGGVREMEVSKGRVISEHTPVRAYAGAGANAVMDFKRLNLDSQGAFTIANQEAAKRNVAFDSVSYLLRSDAQSGAPVWILRLIDVNHALVGTITIAADNGNVLNTAGFGPQQQAAASAPPPPPVASTLPPVQPDGDAPPPDNGPPYGVGHEINKGLHRIGGALQQFFTGQRTVDKRFDNEP
jgi:hypothetical protein